MSIPEYSNRHNRIRLDFMSAKNPFSMPETALNALTDRAAWNETCVDTFGYFAKAVADREKTAPENIIWGNDTEDLVYRIVQAIRPKKALLYAPAPEIYRNALLGSGCDIKEYMLTADDCFGLTADFADCIEPDTDMVFLCSPNDPTGEVITPYTLGTIAESCRRCNTLLICDESYMELTQKSRKYSAESLSGMHIIILKDLGKTYSISGMGLAYAVFAADRIADIIRKYSPARTVPAAACVAAEAALEDEAYLKRSRRYISRERKFLSEQLTRMGIMVYPSDAVFLLFRCELPLAELLMKRGIRITSCADSVGLGEGYFRIAVRTHGENVRFVDEVERILRAQLGNVNQPETDEAADITE